jgi:Tfp pilus assembly protein PilF
MQQLLIIPVLVAALLSVGCASNQPSKDETRGSVHLQSGVDALHRKDYSAALRSLNEAAKFTPKVPEIWSNMGVAYAGKNDVAKAEESWKRALALDSKYHDARLNLGILYTRQQRYPEAERVLIEASKDLTYSKLSQIAYRRAIIYLRLNRPLLAEQQLKKSVEENKTFCPAWFRLGQIQKERGDYAEAANSFNGSVAGTCYKNPEAHYEIAQLYLKVKDMKQARSKFLEVIQLFPSSEWAQKSEATLNALNLSRQ